MNDQRNDVDWSELTGAVILLIPFGAIGAIWYTELTSGFPDQLLTILFGSVLFTAAMVAIDANLIGIGNTSDVDKKGRRKSGPIAWFFAVWLFWIFAYPIYTGYRARYRAKDLSIGGVLLTLVFAWTTYTLGSKIMHRIEAASAPPRNINPAMIVPPPPVMPPAPPINTAVRMSNEQSRFARDRMAIKTKRPKTEADVEQMLGRDPDQCIDTPAYRICQWYYETKEVGRDVIGVTFEGTKVVNTIY